MAELTIVVADVRSLMTGTASRALAGEAIVAGEPYYLDSSNLAKKAGKSTAILANVEGVATHSADTGDWVHGIKRGPIDVGVTLTDSQPYYLGSTGKIGLYADLSTGDFVTLLGHGNDDGNLDLNIQATGNAIP